MGIFRSLTNQGPAVDSTTVAGSVAATSTGNVTLISSGPGSIYVYAYSFSVTSTIAMTVRLMSGSTTAECWRTVLANSTSVVNMSESNVVTPPGYLFRTAGGDPLTYEKGASSVTGALQHYALGFWRG